MIQGIVNILIGWLVPMLGIIGVNEYLSNKYKRKYLNTRME
jgi:hypothetical protein